MPKKTVTTAAGKVVGLDARPDRLDLRDLPYRAPVRNLPPRFPSLKDITQYLPNYVAAELILNQGQEGACTGFGLAATMNYLLWQQSGFALQAKDRVSPRMLYQLAKFYDEWPDENYEGSSCRGALKGLQKHGVCKETLWPYNPAQLNNRPASGWDLDAVKRPMGVYYRIDRDSVVDLQSAIINMGAIYVSSNVHSGWMHVPATKASYDSLPVIQYDSNPIGGHAFAIVGYNEHGFIIQNSWGTNWGASGFAVLTYADWVENGTDAWVIALGVPVANDSSASKFKVTSIGERGLALLSAGAAPWQRASDPLDKRPQTWSREQAYAHTIVTGNNGKLLNRMPHLSDARENAEVVCQAQPLAWFKHHNGPKHVALYLHGGLNSEEESINRIRILGPVFEQNNIYPIFLTWKSGWQETIRGMLSDKFDQLFGAELQRGIGDFLDEARDRTLEVFSREVLVRSMWTEMKQNVEVPDDGDPNAGISVLADNLSGLRKQLGGLQIHLVGHSAGSVAGGSVLAQFARRKEIVDSCSLMAPACTVEFANKFYVPALSDGTLNRSRFTLQVLSDERELGDTVGPYGKSLLYLVSRALENQHKTPLLGLANTFDPSRATDEYWHPNALPELKLWQKFYGAANATLRLESDPQVSNGPCMIKATHGSFDNSIRAITEVLRNILQTAPPLPPQDLNY
jgi:pimeloyl-ACP methyl ester carboxylesterase